MYENSLYIIKPKFNYLDGLIQLIVRVVMRMKIQEEALVRYMTYPSTHTHIHIQNL